MVVFDPGALHKVALIILQWFSVRANKSSACFYPRVPDECETWYHIYIYLCKHEIPLIGVITKCSCWDKRSNGHTIRPQVPECYVDYKCNQCTAVWWEFFCTNLVLYTAHISHTDGFNKWQDKFPYHQKFAYILKIRFQRCLCWVNYLLSYH